MTTPLERRQQRYAAKMATKASNHDIGTGGELLALIRGVRMEMCSGTAPVAVSFLQGQLEVATRINSTMQQTIAAQSRDIARLTAEAQTLQGTIDSMNGTIANFRAQLAIIPTLQTQISALEKSVEALRQTLSQILAMI